MLHAAKDFGVSITTFTYDLLLCCFNLIHSNRNRPVRCVSSGEYIFWWCPKFIFSSFVSHLSVVVFRSNLLHLCVIQWAHSCTPPGWVAGSCLSLEVPLSEQTRSTYTSGCSRLWGSYLSSSEALLDPTSCASACGSLRCLVPSTPEAPPLGRIWTADIGCKTLRTRYCIK